MVKNLTKFFFELFEIVVFSLAIFLVVYLLIMQPHKIQGASMEPNFHNNEYLITDKITYRLREPQKGDVIVFRSPPTYQEELIKRIIGVPGDSVSIENGMVIVNGTTLKESYIPDDFATLSRRFIKEGEIKIVPDNSYFVLGDNREHSLDSREFGFVEKDKITGIARFIYWPASEFGFIQHPSY